MNSNDTIILVALASFITFSYGVYAVFRFASGEIRRDADGTLGSEAVMHIMFWTVVPPVWFGYAIISWERGASLAVFAPAPAWLAILLAILCLARETRS